MPSEVAIIASDSGNSHGRKLSPWQDFGIIFEQRMAFFCLLLVTIHQIIVAGSTIFLTNTISKFQSNQAYFADLCLYLMAMALPYVPGCASFVVMQRWLNQSHHRLIEKFTATVTGSRPNYRNATMRENVTAVLARNSFPVLKDYISFIHDLASFSFNSLLSISVIVFLLPVQLAGGYCLSLALCFLIVLGLQKTIATTSSHCEYAYLRYSGLLCGFWPNIVLGNKHNESIWRVQRESAGRSFYSTSNRLEVLRQSGNLLLAAASLGPTIFLIVAIARSDTIEPAIVAALIVSLTRIFLIINSLSTLVYRVLDYSSLHARMRVILDAQPDVIEDSDEPVMESIDIMINEVSVQDISEGMRLIAPNKFGRFTITGANGSGKSAFLLALKRAYSETCFLLPTDYLDLAWKEDSRALSTGQRLVSHLNEILNIKTVDYILLDEWDANLDTGNIERIEKILEALSTTKVIIEVRHRRSQT